VYSINNNCTSESQGNHEARARSRSIPQDSEDSVEQQSKGCCRKFFGIELVMFLQGLGFSGMTIIVQNFYIDRICRISDNFTEEACDTLVKNASNGIRLLPLTIYFETKRSLRVE
jgi:hypothetical protein